MANLSPGAQALLEQFKQAQEHKLDPHAQARMTSTFAHKLASGQTALPGIDATPIVLPKASWLGQLLASGVAKLGVVAGVAIMVGAGGAYLVRDSLAPETQPASVVSSTVTVEPSGTAVAAGNQISATPVPAPAPSRAPQPSAAAPSVTRAAPTPTPTITGPTISTPAARAPATVATRAAAADTEREPTVQAVSNVAGHPSTSTKPPHERASARASASNRDEARAIREPAPQPSAAQDAPPSVASVVTTVTAPPLPTEQAAPVAPPAPTAAVAREAPAREPAASQSTLDIELALVRRAYSQLSSGHPVEAFATLDQHAARFPHGELEQAREVARMLALCAMGRAPAAHVRAEQFLTRFPESPFVGRVRGMCPPPVKAKTP